MTPKDAGDSSEPGYLLIRDKDWYARIKRETWKIPVLDRLYRVDEDVRRAISTANWCLVEDGQGLTIAPPASQERSALMDEAQAVVSATFWYIDRAAQSLTPPDRRWRRWWERLSRGSLAPAYINLHAAETSRVLLLSADQLKAVLPSIRQHVAAYLQIGDPRRTALDGVPDLTAPTSQTLTRLQGDIVSRVADSYAKALAPAAAQAPAPAGSAEPATGTDEAEAEDAAQTRDSDAVGNEKTPAPVLGPAVDQAADITRLTDMLGLDQQIAAEATGEAYKAEDLQQGQVRRFRWVLLGTFVGLFVLVVFMGIVASLEPSYLPLCLPEQGAKSGVMICPTGVHMPNSADLPLILGMGFIGAALAVSTSLARQKVVVGVRYSLSVAQGLVKLAFGALTGVLGIIILGTQTSEIPGILGTQAGLLTTAVVFGYSQEIFTRVIDRQANSLLNAASPTTPATGQGPASTPLAGTR